MLRSKAKQERTIDRMKQLFAYQGRGTTRTPCAAYRTHVLCNFDFSIEPFRPKFKNLDVASKRHKRPNCICRVEVTNRPQDPIDHSSTFHSPIFHSYGVDFQEREAVFDSAVIGIPSVQRILTWCERRLPNGNSVGVVKSSKTVNYKKFTPFRDGLFCERIFGPVTSFVCACGKTKPHPNVSFCEKCEVEYTDKRARRYRLGYVALLSPVVHVWYLKGRPSYLSLFLGKRKRTIEPLAECKAYLVEHGVFTPDTRNNLFCRKRGKEKATWNETVHAHIVVAAQQLQRKIDLALALQITSKPEFALAEQERSTNKLSPSKVQAVKVRADLTPAKNVLRYKDHLNSAAFRAVNPVKDKTYLSNLDFNASVPRVDFRAQESYLYPTKYFCNVDFRRSISLYLKKKNQVHERTLKSKARTQESFSKMRVLVRPKNLLKFRSQQNTIGVCSNKTALEKRFVLSNQKRSGAVQTRLSLQRNVCGTRSASYERLCPDRTFQFVSVLPRRTVALPHSSFRKVAKQNVIRKQNNLVSLFQGSPSNTELDTQTNRLQRSAVYHNEAIGDTRSMQSTSYQPLARTAYTASQRMRRASARDVVSTPFHEREFYIRAQTFPFLPNLVLGWDDRDWILDFMYSNPRSQDMPLAMYCSHKRWKPLQDVNKFMAEQIMCKLKKVDENPTKPEKLCLPKGRHHYLWRNQIPEVATNKSIFLNGAQEGQDASAADLPSVVKKQAAVQSWSAEERNTYRGKNLVWCARAASSLEPRNGINQNVDTGLRRNSQAPPAIEHGSSKTVSSDMGHEPNNTFISAGHQPPGIEHKQHKQTKPVTKSKREKALLHESISSTTGLVYPAIKEILSFTSAGALECLLQRFNPGSFKTFFFAEAEILRKYYKERPLEPVDAVKVYEQDRSYRRQRARVRRLANRVCEKHCNSKNKLNLRAKDERTGGLDGDRSKTSDFKADPNLLSILQTPSMLQHKMPNLGGYLPTGLQGKDEVVDRRKLNRLSQFIPFCIHKRLRFRLFRYMRRLKVVQLFSRNNRRPEWMLISHLPVLPPDLRPILEMDESLTVTSDLNTLYQRVIYRNNRYEKMTFVDFYRVRLVQRLIQDGVDRLIENGKSGAKPYCTPSGRPLKSLADILKGKKGRFRLNLLGKRVDFSGRSVIVVSPNLKIHECGLPRDIALELYHYFLLRELMVRGYRSSLVLAKKVIKERTPIIWNLLSEIVYFHPVLLNRAPTLHRLGIQAFQPRLVLGSAILLHPLVCSGFNADFDGDQMGVHLPLGFEARAETWDLLWSRNNLLSPATGQPILVPTQDMVLGFYYMTSFFDENKKTVDTHNRALKTNSIVRAEHADAKHKNDNTVATQIANRNIQSNRSSLPGLQEQATNNLLPARDFLSEPDQFRQVIPNREMKGQEELTISTGYKEIDVSNNAIEVSNRTHRKHLYFDIAARRVFSNTREIIAAFQRTNIFLHTPVWLKWSGSIENDGRSEKLLEVRVNPSAYSTQIYRRYTSSNGVLKTQFLCGQNSQPTWSRSNPVNHTPIHKNSRNTLFTEQEKLETSWFTNQVTNIQATPTLTPVQACYVRTTPGRVMMNDLF